MNRMNFESTMNLIHDAVDADDGNELHTLLENNRWIFPEVFDKKPFLQWSDPEASRPDKHNLLEYVFYEERPNCIKSVLVFLVSSRKDPYLYFDDPDGIQYYLIKLYEEAKKGLESARWVHTPTDYLGYALQYTRNAILHQTDPSRLNGDISNLFHLRSLFDSFTNADVILELAEFQDSGIPISLKNVFHGDVNEVDDTGRTMLHHAVMFNRYDMVKDLLEMGADPRIPSDRGDNILELLQQKNTPTPEDFNNDTTRIRALLSEALNATGEKNRTPTYKMDILGSLFGDEKKNNAVVGGKRSRKDSRKDSRKSSRKAERKSSRKSSRKNMMGGKRSRKDSRKSSRKSERKSRRSNRH